MNTFNVTELQDGFFFTEDLFLDKKFILLTPGMPITQEFRRALRDWEFLKVFSEGRSTNDDLERTTISVTPDAFDDFEEKDKAAKTTEGTEAPETTAQSLTDVEKTYYEFQAFIADVYTRFVTRKDLQQQIISDKVKELCDLYGKTDGLFCEYNLPRKPAARTTWLFIQCVPLFLPSSSPAAEFPSTNSLSLVACILHEIAWFVFLPRYTWEKELPG